MDIGTRSVLLLVVGVFDLPALPLFAPFFRFLFFLWLVVVDVEVDVVVALTTHSSPEWSLSACFSDSSDHVLMKTFHPPPPLWLDVVTPVVGVVTWVLAFLWLFPPTVGDASGASLKVEVLELAIRKVVGEELSWRMKVVEDAVMWFSR